MKILFDEISQRFPEIRNYIFDGDEELPYVLMGHLADWLKTLLKEGITPELAARLVSFARWCEEQPRREEAGDDILTIMVVGFFEKLFDSDVTRPLVPNFSSRDDLIANAEYLRHWVGADNYDKALKCFESDA